MCQRQIGVFLIAADVRDGHHGVEIRRSADRLGVYGLAVHVRIPDGDADVVGRLRLFALGGVVTLADDGVQTLLAVVRHPGLLRSAAC